MRSRARVHAGPGAGHGTSARGPALRHLRPEPRPAAAVAPRSAGAFARQLPAHRPGLCTGSLLDRAATMALYDGEDWFLQLDSHMDFDDGWDERLVAQAEALQAGRPGVVISSYPNAFAFEHGLPVRRSVTQGVLAHVLKPGTQFDPQHPVLAFEAHPVDSERPLRGFHLGAGCLFAPGRFALAFPYDPALYFHGEEQALAARLFTHGWDIVHMPALPIYHLYNDGASGAPPRPLHWDQAHEAKRSLSWWTLEQRSRARLAAVLRGDPLGVYGLGTVRTMAEYAALSGIDYAARTLGPQAYRPLPPA
ncbi:GlcNAc-transferase family protein [Ramlibacter sp. MMS24-I3-19]|uniref:GlcNAc-transferase family protein n=1 Tax=Ramlibacter sp. MMS24-I3-19 TaxID=3416606 RepID=UPI003CFD57F4